MPITNALLLKDYLNLPEPDVEWIIQPLIPVGGLANMYGRQKAGKSAFANQLAIALAHGHREFLGLPLSGKKMSVLYVQLDTPRVTWKRRFRDLEQHGILLPETGLAIIDKEMGPYPFDILQPSHFEYLKAQVKLHGADLVILDILREIHRGDEDKSDQMQQVLAKVDLACRPAAVLLLSHGKKPPTDPNIEVNIMDEGRGSSHVSARCDTVMRLRETGRKDSEGNKPFALDFKGRSIDDTTIDLIRDDGPKEAPRTFFYSLAKPVVDEFTEALKCVMTDTSLENDYARARQLEALTGEKLEKCRSAVRRWSF